VRHNFALQYGDPAPRDRSAAKGPLLPSHTKENTQAILNDMASKIKERCPCKEKLLKQSGLLPT